MSFVQPWLLAALPLMALPIIIHLINQRRYQSVPWGAMMFLLTANRMSRGYARLRQWLILLLRTLAIATLVFAIARPLASGWIGAATGRSSNTAIVILDRSPSMQQRGLNTPLSKLETGVSQLTNTLRTIGTTNVLLVDAEDFSIEEIPSNATFAGRTDTSPFDAVSDIPGMLTKALEYLESSRVGQADIWICSDLRASDWGQDDGRWESIRQTSRALESRVRFHLLSYSNVASDNFSVRVSNAQRSVSTKGAELALTIALSRTGQAETMVRVPLDIEVGGIRSRIEVDFEGKEFELRDYRFPIPEDLQSGWGRIMIPGDSNPADNEAFFVFDQPQSRKTLVVGDDESIYAPLKLVSSISPNSDVVTETDIRSSNQLEGLAWEEYALILWHAPLPREKPLEEIERLVARGGVVMFFPPQDPGIESAFGLKWGTRKEFDREIQVESWKSDGDLFQKTQGGQSLPIGSLKFRANVPIEGEQIKLAILASGDSILSRATTEKGAVYFWGVTPARQDSSLASDGVVFYVAIQRALAEGAKSLLNTRIIDAGEENTEKALQWERLAAREGSYSDAPSVTSGAYRNGSKLLAVNRPVNEDATKVLNDEDLQSLFQDLPFDRVDDAAGNLAAIVQEIWRVFLIGMMAAMVIEAALCLPKKTLDNQFTSQWGKNI